MSGDLEALAAILLMGLATYATRIAGFLLIRRFAPSPFLEAWFNHVPGAVFVALVAPGIWSAGPAGWLSAATAFAAMRWTGQFLTALVLSLLVFAGARYVLT